MKPERKKQSRRPSSAGASSAFTRKHAALWRTFASKIGSYIRCVADGARAKGKERGLDLETHLDLTTFKLTITDLKTGFAFDVVPTMSRRAP